MGIGVGCLGAILFGIMFISSLSSLDSSTGLMWFSIIGFVVSVFGGLYLDQKRKDDLSVVLAKKIKEIVGEIEGFNITQEFISPNMESFIAIDENSKKVCIIENKHDNQSELSQTLSKYDYESRVFTFKDVLQSEILEDDATITKTSRGGQIGGAILGGILAGGVGAVIGGLSSSQTSTNEVKKIQLQVIVNDTKKSFNRITFMSLEGSVNKNSPVYKNANKNVTHWHNLISHLINRADQEDISINKDKEHDYINKNQSSSIADEIKKLSELYKEGILSEEEFTSQKQKLLG